MDALKGASLDASFEVREEPSVSGKCSQQYVNQLVVTLKKIETCDLLIYHSILLGLDVSIDDGLGFPTVWQDELRHIDIGNFLKKKGWNREFYWHRVWITYTTKNICTCR